MRTEITLLNFDGVLQSGIHGIRDLDLMCQQALSLLGESSPFEITELTLTKESVFDADDVGEIVFLAPVIMAPELVDLLLPELGFVVDWLSNLRGRKNTQICGCCASVLLLAEAGLLHDKSATTTWWMLSDLQKRYPAIDIQHNKMLVDSDSVITSSGPFSFVSQFLYLLEQFVSPEASRLVAKVAVVEPGKPANGIFVVPTLLASKDPWLMQVQELIMLNLGTGISVTDIASTLNLTERTLHRRVKEKAGMSPRALISAIKVEVAKTLLETCSDPIATIGASVGFVDDSSFRAAFTKAVGITPTAYRSRMNPRAVAGLTA